MVTWLKLGAIARMVRFSAWPGPLTLSHLSQRISPAPQTATRASPFWGSLTPDHSRPQVSMRLPSDAPALPHQPFGIPDSSHASQAPALCTPTVPLASVMRNSPLGVSACGAVSCQSAQECPHPPCAPHYPAHASWWAGPCVGRPMPLLAALHPLPWTKRNSESIMLGSLPRS